MGAASGSGMSQGQQQQGYGGPRFVNLPSVETGPQFATSSAGMSPLQYGFTQTPEGQAAGGQQQMNANIQQQVQNLMGNYGSMVDLANQTQASQADVARAFNTAPGNVYTAMNRPNYQTYGPSGQFYQPIYQSGYRNYMQPTQFYSPGYGGGFGGGMRNPFAYGGGMGGGGFSSNMPMRPMRAAQEDPYMTTPNLSNRPRQMSGMQEGDDFIPSGPRPQMSVAQAFSDFFKQLHPGQTAPPPPITAADNVPVIQRASSVTPGDVTRALLGSSPGLPASLRGGMAKGGHVDEGIAGLLKK